ncbi:HPP family protein [Halobaculum rarum]|uniref:HPP family protein n=1 Tax=Halobaculum rarum TaxID=3075122 RepID=UPI0032B014DE
MRPLPDAVVDALHAAGLLAVAGALAWATGRPLVFPSLGPSAYLIAAGSDRPSGRALLGGHAVGVLAGLAAYHGLADGAAITGALTAGELAGARLAVSGVVSVGLTTFGMALTETRHAPACATTLIVSLGLLPSVADAAVIVVGVVTLWLASRATDLASRAPLTEADAERAER